MTLHPIAFFRSPLTAKFGVPRQSGIVTSLEGEVVFEPAYRDPSYIRGLEGFDYIWLLWGFSANRPGAAHPTVRPPLLGGNAAVGVLATRSPYRPNPIGLSSVRIMGIDTDTADGPLIRVAGADLMDATPIYDIKPYVEYADSHVGVRSGFVDERVWQHLEVVFSPEAEGRLSTAERATVAQLLALDPRPHYHDDPTRLYGMPFAGRDIRFRVEGRMLTVVEVV